MILTVAFPVCTVNCPAEHKDSQLQIFLVDSHWGPALSGVMGLILELKSQQNNLQLLFHSLLTCNGRNGKTFNFVSFKHQSTIFFAVSEYTDLNLSSLKRESLSSSLKCSTLVCFSTFPLRSSSLRCDGFDFRAEVRVIHCFSLILHVHNLKIKKTHKNSEKDRLRSMMCVLFSFPTIVPQNFRAIHVFTVLQKGRVQNL